MKASQVSLTAQQVSSLLMKHILENRHAFALPDTDGPFAVSAMWNIHPDANDNTIVLTFDVAPVERAR